MRTTSCAVSIKNLISLNLCKNGVSSQEEYKNEDDIFDHGSTDNYSPSEE